MHWPQITYIVLTTLGVGAALQKYSSGVKSGIEFAVAITGAAFMVWLLWCGGFFG